MMEVGPGLGPTLMLTLTLDPVNTLLTLPCYLACLKAVCYGIRAALSPQFNPHLTLIHYHISLHYHLSLPL